MIESQPTTSTTLRAAFYDLGRLFSFRDQLEALRREAPPKAVSVDTVGLSSARRVGILPGSFNPPTRAHIELARWAKKLFGLDTIFFTLSRVTVDKEKIEGVILEDRLLLLSLIARELECAGVAVVNRGLYYEQAQAFRSLLGNRARISFIAGVDKLIQIFDAGYYQDREQALRVLLTEAQLLVATRGPLGIDDMERVLNRSENEPYRDRVFPFTLPDGVRQISSSAVRSEVAAGRGYQEEVPEVAAAFIAETLAYLPGYEFRARLFNRLYETQHGTANFFDLVKEADKNHSKGPRGLGER